MTPQTNAPRVESRPIPSEITAPRTMKAAATKQEAPTPGSPSRSELRPVETTSARPMPAERRATRLMMTRTTSAVSVRARSPDEFPVSPALWRWAMAAMIDSPTQTVASSSASTLSESWLRSRCRTRRSAKILTITGTALTDTASPAKTAKVAVVASGPRNRGSAASANATVDTKGNTKAPTPVRATVRALARTNLTSTVAPATPTSRTPQKAPMPRRNSS
jgi:hypothetical protein